MNHHNPLARNVSQLLIRIVVKCLTNITDRCFLIDCRLIPTRWMMISGQTEAEVTCAEKAEIKTAQEEETVLVGKESESEVNETDFWHKTMAVLYKTATMLFFCGTFSYFMANEPEPLSVLEALTYQVQNGHLILNPRQTKIPILRGWSSFASIQYLPS